MWAVAQDGPVLYGEGAVAHAALLARDRLEYGPYPADAIFVAANYPPLYFHLASFGDPFIVGRVASVVATVFVAGAIAYRARASGGVVAALLAASFLAVPPVISWGAALKPDPLALAFTVGAVLAIDARRPTLGGVLVALAVWAKPTAALPAVALLAWLAASDRRALARYVVAALAAFSIMSLATHLPDDDFFTHVVTYNALGFDVGQALVLALVGLLCAGVVFVTVIVVRPHGPIAAYAAGAIAIVALGGREGATVNYLLDALAASWLVLAGSAPRIRMSLGVPLALSAQLVLAFALLDPFQVLPFHVITSGQWRPADRVPVVRALPGPLLVEDSGLLMADGRNPAVDDVFLWSRLQDRRDDTRLIDAVRAATFAAVVSEADLEQLDAAPLYERQRWYPALVTAILGRYRLDQTAHGLFVYLPR